VPTPVSEYTTTPVLTVEPDETLASAVEAMAAKEIHSLVVITDGCHLDGSSPGGRGRRRPRIDDRR